MRSFHHFIMASLRGIGQVVFQDSALSGLLFLAGIFCNSLTMGVFALAGSMVGTLAARLLRYDGKEIRDGLYGFNGTLAGIAVPCFLSVNVWSVMLMVVASVASTLVAHVFGKQKLLPGLTAPFVVITWALLLVASVFPVLQPGGQAAAAGAVAFAPVRALSLGYSQIMLQGGSIFTGLLFFVAIAVNSVSMAWKSALACVLSLTVVLLPFIGVSSVNDGMWGYNAILAFLAVTDIVPVSSFRRTKAFAALLLSFVFQYAGMRLGLVTLTAPFVLSVWAVVLYDRYMNPNL